MTFIDFLKTAKMQWYYINKSKKSVMQEVENGDITAIEVLVKLKAIESVISDLREKLMPTALNELAAFGSKEVPLHGVLLTSMETGVVYDYSVCKDTEWELCKKREKEIAEIRKKREAKLKFFIGDFFNEKEPLVDEITGEIVKPKIVPTRKSTTTIKIEIPRTK